MPIATSSQKMPGQAAKRSTSEPTIGPTSGAIAITVISIDIICAARAPE